MSALLIPLLLAASLGQKPFIVIFDIENRSGESLKSLDRFVAEEVVSTGRYRIYPKTELRRALEAEGVSRCRFPMCQTKMLRQFKADRGLTIFVGRFADKCLVSVRFVDRMMRTLSEVSVEDACEKRKIEQMVDKAVRKLLSADGARFGGGQKSAQALEREAARHLSQQRLEEAREALERCLVLEARPGCHRSFGVYYAKKGEGDKALQHYKRYLELAPHAPDADQVRAMISGKRR